MLAATAAKDPSAAMSALDYLRSGFEDPLTLFFIALSLLILFFWYFATDIENRKRNIGTILILGICGLCVLAATPPRERLKGGIDILGGSAFTLRVQPREGANGQMEAPTASQIDQAIVVLRNRLDSAGTNEAQINRLGEDQIQVQMPGVSEQESAEIREAIEKVAKLELREVSPRNDEVIEGKTLAQRAHEGLEIVPGYRAYMLKGKTEEGKEYEQPILLNRRTALGGSDIVNAYPSPQQNDAVAVTLSSEGADKMFNLTRNMRLKVDRIAVVLDGEVLNAPVVNAVLSKDFVISGLHDPGEPKALSDALMNPLENPLVVETQNKVSAAYGSAIITQAIWAGVVGLAITFLFVLLYYRAAGLVAVVGLLVNGVILFGIMAMFGFPFSLPGIAGMILTIGMAVDANVLIYERLREEMAAGKTLKSAISSSYEKAFTAIFDSNFTSLITALILFWLASGTIKGFAVTLTIGLLASLFSAILVTRVLFRWSIDLGVLKKLSFMSLIPPTKIDFLGKRKIAFVISVALIVVCAANFYIKRNDALGIDFTGGSVIQFQLAQDQFIPIDEVNKALDGLTLSKEANATEESSAATGVLLSVRCATEDAGKISAKLRESIPVLGERLPANQDGTPGEFKIAESAQEVSASAGSTYITESLIALGLGLVGIFLYIAFRFEFAFAIGGFLSTVHDVVLTIGLIVLFGSELSLLHVGAILTVAGYSLNDTIVIYDRIRERLRYETGSIESIMNEAINATLARTILTAGTTIITLVIIYFRGGPSLEGFALTILVGLIIGTISSVYIATPIVLWWGNRKGGNLRSYVVKEKKAEALPEPAN
ncbi:protein translocase subunit SecD [Luteolibacter sp. SL250]|uniref:protein translocase subunit SecD n=1 Tax=Luteolibacter sp. SL250 TaxID=2995170 RepID=UPI002271FD8B|nr:protein translocase subunit SecD [Luteolibacter sp. SL250]WAC19196.1 protein translocase subunit SecD [Luteolibacter sp. SL250]